MNQFYYLDQQNEQRGPVYASDLPAYGVTGSTLVWAYWMDDWTPASQVPELAPYFPQSSPIPNQTVVYADDSNVPNNPNDPYTANNPYAPNNPYSTNNPYPSNSPYTANSPYPSNSPYTANNPYSPNKAKTWTIIALISGIAIAILGFIWFMSQNHNDQVLSDDEVVREFNDIDSDTAVYENPSDYYSDDSYSDDSYSDDSYSDDDEDTETLLRLALSYAKADLPEEIDEGIVLTDVKLTNDCFLYIAECDEDIVDIDILNAVKSMLQDEMTKSIKEDIASDSDIQEFVKYCKKAHRGIGYKYVGKKSGKTCTVKIPYTQL